LAWSFAGFEVPSVMGLLFVAFAAERVLVVQDGFVGFGPWVAVVYL